MEGERTSSTIVALNPKKYHGWIKELKGLADLSKVWHPLIFMFPQKLRLAYISHSLLAGLLSTTMYILFIRVKLTGCFDFGVCSRQRCMRWRREKDDYKMRWNITSILVFVKMKRAKGAFSFLQQWIQIHDVSEVEWSKVVGGALQRFESRTLNFICELFVLRNRSPNWSTQIRR